MLKLNLLPPHVKKELELKAVVRWLKFFCTSLIAALLIFVILGANSFAYLYIIARGQAKLIDTKTNTEDFQRLKEIESKIVQANQEVIRLSSLQDSFVCLTPILEEITELRSKGIDLDLMSYQASVNDGKITGTADTRENYIKFEDGLKNHKLFVNIESPLSNIIKKENLNFVLDFQINTSTANCINQDI